MSVCDVCLVNMGINGRDPMTVTTQIHCIIYMYAVYNNLPYNYVAATRLLAVVVAGMFTS